MGGFYVEWNAQPHVWVPMGAPSLIRILCRRRPVLQLPQNQRLQCIFVPFPATHFTFEISSVFTVTICATQQQQQQQSAMTSTPQKKNIPLRTTKFRSCSHLAMLPMKARTCTGPASLEIWHRKLPQKNVWIYLCIVYVCFEYIYVVYMCSYLSPDLGIVLVFKNRLGLQRSWM